MATPSQKLAAAVVLASGVLLLALWPDFGAPTERPATEPPASSPGTLSAPSAGAAAPDQAATTTDPAGARDVIVAPAAPTTGSLLVRAIWGDDKTAAAGVLLEVHTFGDDMFDHPRGTTDEHGRVRFADLPQKRVYVESKRGDLGDGVRVEVIAGKEVEVTLPIAVGMNARGIVVDGRGAAIAGAEVVVAGWGGGEGFALARTAQDGTFLLRSIGTHCHIGARAKGYAPSLLRQFSGGKGAEIELRIELSAEGATLRGAVLDPQNRPVPGAVVQAGEESQRSMQKLPDGAYARPPHPERARTGTDGQFAFHGVAPGTVLLWVRARGLAPARQVVEVLPRADNEVVVRLEPGVTLTGIVRDAAGAPVDKAEVMAGTWNDFARQRLVTRSDGAFRLDGLWPGELKVSAEVDAGGKASATLQASAGQTLQWDPVLSAGLVFRGRVLDVDGKPVRNAIIEGVPERFDRDNQWFGHANTDAEGRFTLANCTPDAPFTLTVRRKSVFPELRQPHVVPGPDELILHLPKEAWIRIRGAVLGPDGKPLPSVALSPSMQGGSGSPAETADPATGAFDLGPYPPGEYSMNFRADGLPSIRLPRRAVLPDEVWDVGTVRFQRGGSLAVTLSAAGAPLPKVTLGLYDAAGNRVHVDRLEAKDGVARSGPLAPGAYFLQVTSSECASVHRRFEVQMGVETQLAVQLAPGIAVHLEFALPSAATTPEGVTVALADASGVVVTRATAWARDGAPKLDLALPAGTYQVVASATGCQGAAKVVVAAPGPVPAKVTMTPK